MGYNDYDDHNGYGYNGYNGHERPQRRQQNVGGSTPAERSYQQRREAAARQSMESGHPYANQPEDVSRYSDRSRYSSQQRVAGETERRQPTPRQRQSAQGSRNGRAAQGRAQGTQERTQARTYQSHVQYAEAQWNNNPQASPYEYDDPSRYAADVDSYHSLYTAQRAEAAAKRGNGPLIAGGIIAAIIVAALVWFFIIPHPFNVTVNSREVTVDSGSTVATLVEKGYARPTPGNLMAIDGSLITAGEGEPFTATIDGKQVPGDTRLAKDMVVEIDNGGDKTEDYTTSEEAVPFDTVNDDMSFEAYWTGSIHQMSDGVDGLATTKTGTVSGKKVQEITKQPVSGGYHNYTVQTDQPVIALTFDDGPWPETTDQILDILEANGAKATFFTIGEQVAPYADAVKRANSLGCEVVTHSWDHASGSGNGVDLTLMSAEEQIAEVQQGYAAIKNVLGVEPAHLLRAPGGNFHGDIINTLWPYVDAEIGWDVDTEDWARPGVDAIVSRILSVQPGQVILMHDGGGDRAQTVEALRTALPELIQRGYKCVTVSELLTYHNASGQAAAAAEPTAETVEMEEA